MALSKDIEGLSGGSLMRKPGSLIAIAVLLTLAILACSSPAPSGGGGATPGGNGETPGPGGVQWLYDWQAARDRAEAENKPILLYFYGESCRACRRLADVTFPNEALAAFLNEKYVPVKVETEGSPVVAKHYGVDSKGVSLFIAPDGTEIGRTSGFRHADQYLTEAEAMLETWQSPPS
jgi:hypothetical protein